MNNKNLSIIVPSLNEEGSVKELVKRVDQAMKNGKIKYELIYVDDHSQDETVKVLKSMQGKNYPLSVYMKKGQIGKAWSLIEGFSYAKYPLVAILDADLQYPPEALVEMHSKMREGADVVIGNRVAQKTSILRKVMSKTFKYLFGQLLHGLTCDVQSGMKMLRKEVTERVSIDPQSSWTFDLEFLIKAKQAGYSIDSVDIEFYDRQAGKTKINIVKSTLEIALNALKLKFAGANVIPFGKDRELVRGKGFHYRGAEFVHHTDLPHQETAFQQMNLGQMQWGVGMLVVLVISLLLNWHLTVVVILAVIISIYFLNMMFNGLIIYKSLTKSPEIQISGEQIAQVKDAAWPTYTIFCPLYKEWQVVPQFVDAMNKLDYPKSKLQVILLLEEDDKETIAKVKTFNLPKHFEVAVVPDSQPKTKPKALNYGLGIAKGEYVVIYDAEDLPDADQLKKVILAFKQVSNTVVCVQAKLNFYNPNQNLLTRLFTAEYSLWFDLILTGLQGINAPIPLGGTSNHFRVKDIKSLQGWDPFNVTEDCDLGMRLVKKGYQTALVESTTWEEANSRPINWYKQRSRWIKGYIQTYLVHMRNPQAFGMDWKNPHLITFQLIVSGIMSLVINPLMWMTTISYFAFRPTLGPIIESFFPLPVLYMGVFCTIFGNFMYLYSYMISCARRGQDDIIKYVYFVPIYWLGMCIAAWRAMYEVVHKPHYWAKTVHGFHLTNTVAAKPKLKKKKLPIYSLDLNPAFNQ